MTIIADLLVKIGADIGEMQTGFDTAESKLATFSQSLTSAGTGLIELSAPFTALGVVAAKTAGDFEASMNILSVAVGDSGASLEDLRAVAIQAGSDVNLVGVGAADVATAMTNFTKAGMDTNDMLGDMQGYLDGTAQLGGALRAAIDLAAASELDLDQASKLVTTTMSTFGLSADEVVGAMNNYVQSADASVASVSGLAEAMNNVGPTMAAFGFTLEDTNTALAILSTRGIEGAEAGTALKSMMLNLMRPTEDVKNALAGMNVALYDQDGAMRPLPDILADIERGMAGMTEEQVNATVQTLAGSYGQKAMNTLLSEGAVGWAEMEKSIASAATMEESAAAQTQGFNAAMEQLKSSVETFLINVGTPLIEDVLTPMVQKFTEITGKIAEVNPGFLEFGIVAGGIVTALGTVMVIVGQVAGAFSALAGLFGTGGALAAVGPAIAAIAGPVGIVAAAVAALALAWNNNWFGIKDTVTNVWESNIRPALQDMVSWLEREVPRAVQAAAGYWESSLLPALRDVYNFINQYIVPVFRGIADVLDSVLGLAIRAFAGLWDNVLLPALRTVWSFLLLNVQPIFDAIGKALSAEGPVGKAIAYIKDLFEKLAPSLTVIKEALGTIAGWFGTLATKIDALKLPDWLTPGSPTPLETALLGILDALARVASGPWEWFNNLLDLFGLGGGGGGGVGVTINVTVGPGSVVVYGEDPEGMGSTVGLAIARTLAALTQAETQIGAGGGWVLP